MNTITRPSLAALAVLGLSAALPNAACAQNLILNSSFESTTSLDTPLGNGSTAIPSWTVVGTGNQSVAALQNGDFGLSSPYGSQFIDLTGYNDNPPYAGLTQTVGTVSGQTYLVTLSLGADQSDSRYQGPVAVTAMFGGVSKTFTFSPAAGVTGNVWQSFSQTFVAAGPSTALTITGATSGGGQYIGLDNISVAAAPEPSQCAGLGLGVLGLGMLGLRSRKRA